MTTARRRDTQSLVVNSRSSGSSQDLPPDGPSGAKRPTAAADAWAEVRAGLAGSRADLVPALQRAQSAFGYISPDVVDHIARWLHLTPSEVYGVATFYAQFRFSPPGRHRIRVCLGTACHVKGGQQLLDTVQRRLAIREGETTPDGEYELEHVACLGCCALAPVVTVDDDIYGQMSVLKLQGMLGGHDQP